MLGLTNLFTVFSSNNILCLSFTLKLKAVDAAAAAAAAAAADDDVDDDDDDEAPYITIGSRVILQIMHRR